MIGTSTVAAFNGADSRRLQKFRTLLLIATCAVATDVFANLAEIANVKLPTVGGAVPMLAPLWAPFLLLVIWLNAVHDGSGKFLSRITWPSFWLLALIAVMGILEFSHAALNGEVPDPDLLLSFAWICFVWIAVQSFASLENYTSLVIVGFTIFSAIAAILMATYPANSLLASGIFEFIQSKERPVVPIVNSAAYQFALAAILAWAALLLRRSYVIPAWAWAALFVTNSLGVFATKGRGGWLLLTVGVVIILLVKVSNKTLFKLSNNTLFSFRTKILATTLAAAAAVTLLVSTPSSFSRIEGIFSLGRGFGPSADMQIADDRADWDSSSIGIRGNMALKALASFVEHPLAGIGLKDAASMRTMGHSVHGIPLLLLSAYGLAGGLVGAGFLYSLWRSGRYCGLESIMAMCAFAFAVMALQNAPLYLAGVLAIAAGKPNTSKM
jgi:O-Antigen ligase